MKKRILSVMSCLIKAGCILGTSSVAVNAQENEKIVDGSELTTDDTSTGSTKDSVARGEHLMTGECSISKAGISRVYCYGSTTANHEVDKLAVITYVQRYHEDTDDWGQVDWFVEMKQNAESGIEEFAAKLQDTYNFNLTKTNEVKSNIYSTEVESRQQSVMTNLNTVKTELDSLYGSFTDSQKNAIKSDTDEKQQEVSVKFSIKYILAGMILAIICSIAIIIIIYAIKGKLISNDAIWEELNIINYGKVITKTKGGIFRNLADKIRKINKTDSIELIAAKIMLNVEAGNVLIFSGKVDDKLGKLFIDAIKKVADKNVHVKILDGEMNDVEFMKNKVEY